MYMFILAFSFKKQLIFLANFLEVLAETFGGVGNEIILPPHPPFHHWNKTSFLIDNQASNKNP